LHALNINSHVEIDYYPSRCAEKQQGKVEQSGKILKQKYRGRWMGLSRELSTRRWRRAVPVIRN
jgi:hypothetical protein